ncbi:VOC family protein [Planotetraspora phitsanulokensis]|uniref:Extradiol dioxygenase n=1 Tax=Planotetraspora phitsanulokensis TaxID=575192 RepID=A0A8J3UG07_9ACTN|nr:glyoxalase/bleomycin resistance/extradiol dioxygenase family protein [Planotetraspora phitsanulokensis]GII42616.1 extradiol dioxygenase [Planotetraspora phitsanulokensis]
MATKIYVNLPVKDLAVSKDFFAGLGFSFDPRFADENMECMLIGEDSFVMLQAEPYFRTFTKKDVADAGSVTEVIVALGAESRERVDDMVDAALASGGRPSKDTLDLGFVYTRAFEDLDGHLWEATYLDPSALQA